MESRILREEDGFPGEFVEFLFAIGAARVEDFGNVPVMVGARGDEIPIHRPVVIFAESKAVGGVVVAGFGEGNEMSCVDEGDIVACRELNTEAAGGTLMIVDGEYGASKGGRAAVFEFFLGNSEDGWVIEDCWLLILGLKKVGEIARQQSLAEILAVVRCADGKFEAVSQLGENLADLVDEWGGLQRDATVSILDPCLPESLGLESEERVFRRILVVVFADLQKSSGEAVAQILAPRDAVWCGFSFINEIERGEEEQRFVRPLVRRALFDRCDAGMEVVETFDGLIQYHRSREANVSASWKENRGVDISES